MGPLNTASPNSYLSQDETVALVEDYQASGCKQTLCRIVEGHMNLCRKISRRYASRLGVDDSLQDCIESLILSAKKFDSSRSDNFTLYAQVIMSGALSAKAIQQWNIVCVPQTHAFMKAFRRMGKIPYGQSMTHLLANEIAQSISVDVSYVYGAYSLYCGSVSFDRCTGSDDTDTQSLVDTFEADEGRGPECIVIEQDLHDKSKTKLSQALATLDDRQSIIISKRHLNEKKVSRSEIAEELQVSGERVRQLEAGALSSLQQVISSLN